MADRIIDMREKLYNKLVELNTPGEWGHIKSQIGSFPLWTERRQFADCAQACSHSPVSSLSRSTLWPRRLTSTSLETDESRWRL